jgi:hypothetical protein
MLLGGVVSASLSLVFLAGGAIGLLLGAVVEWADDPSNRSNDRVCSFFVVASCTLLGLSALCGVWVPAVCWIVLAPFLLVGAFLGAMSICFSDEG